ncbi:MAG: alanine racemase [Thermoleophilia bacterium]
MTTTPERAHARVDLEALRHNARLLAGAAGPARLMAVVKADGYGHGAVASARAALEGGATWLGVHTAGEAEELREGGVEAPVLVLGPITGGEWARAAAARAEVAAWAEPGLRAAVAAGVPGIHIKVDTGMGRLGAVPADVPGLAGLAASLGAPVTGVMTHFATADETEGPNAGFMREQLIRFRSTVRQVKERFPDALVHAANSAAALREADARLDMVRCGIALYGCSPFGDDPVARGLRPVMTWMSAVASIKTVHSRDSVGYGRTWRAARGTRIGLVPVGYADGYARCLGNRAHVLVAGRRVPVVGTVSMDQLTVDLGPESTEEVGAPVVLMGADGDERITAEELAGLRGTISYEVVCGVGRRIPRVPVE